MKSLGWYSLAWALAVGLAAGSVGRAAEATAAPVPPAAVVEEGPAGVPVVVWNRTLVEYRLPMEFPSVEERAQAAMERIDARLGAIDPASIEAQPFQIGASRGVMVMAGSRFLLRLMEGDLAPGQGQTLEAAGAATIADLRQLVHDHAAQHTWSVLLRGIIQAALATGLFLGFWMFAVWLKARLLQRLARGAQDGRRPWTLFGYDWGPVLLALAAMLTRLLVVSVVLAAAYGWVTWVLGRFPYTRPWSDQLGGYLVAAVGKLAAGAVHQLPNVIALVVIFLVTRGIVRVLNGWFSAVESGQYLPGWLDAEAARATRRLADIGVWLVALIVAFPYLPGSHSEAFRGISVFLGLMLSLGGAGFVGQIIGGLAAVYSRAVRQGDTIEVNELQGRVKEVGLFSTKLITRTREEVTIPNAMLLGSAIRNYSRVGGQRTAIASAVTIGYDAPWRQVQAMLLEAAARTEGLLAEPAPQVLQTALDDFYVRYELVASAARGEERAVVLARLHGHIQDLFNEHGVQIMSPHFEGQPAAAVLVPKARWHAAPARAVAEPPPAG